MNLSTMQPYAALKRYAALSLAGAALALAALGTIAAPAHADPRPGLQPPAARPRPRLPD